MKVAQLVKVWINLSYRYFTPYSPDRTNCNALDLLLWANTEDCFFNLSWTRHPLKTWFQQLPLQRWFITASGLTKPSCSKGRKRHTAVDTFGLVAWWSQQQVLLNVKRANRFSLSVYQIGQRVSRLYLIWIDRGDSGQRFLKWVMDSLGWIIQVVLRLQQTQGFVLLKKR
ncbi:hypothetical protein [Microcoleus asticus]|uniref:Transposase n=1 Tax=Microcoleus asticus IPMA8 TaxID=2563858 RepID=A0ABX2D5C8_9CYAN|nr:hypothetical protein [Microcoleus asticus IPMA8]